MINETIALNQTRKTWFRLGGFGIAAALLIVSIIAAVSVGAVDIPFSTAGKVAFNRVVPGIITPDWSAGRENIIWDIRFPRVILAGFVGAGLGVVGAAQQAITRNPLADPHLLGISSGGAFGAIAALMHTGMFLGALTVPLMAFAGAIMATLLVLGIARIAGAASADRLILSGVAVSFIVMSCAYVLIFLGDAKAAHTAVFWMLGGLGLAQWSHLIWAALVFVPCGAWLWLQAGRLNAVSLGDETAASLGIEIARFRLTVFIVTALIVGVMVSFSGLIGFVGLMIPHLVRLIVGSDNTWVIPASALSGAVFLIWADAIARIVMAPEDLPIGIVTGICGGVFFIWMMIRDARAKGQRL